MPSRLIVLSLLVAFLSPACVTPGPATLRHPDFRASQIRRPAVVLQVSLDHTGLMGEGEFSSRERSSIPEAIEIGLLEALNAEGIVPVDATLSARRSYRDETLAFERIDRNEALARARVLRADVVLILAVSLSRRDLVYCRAGTHAGGAGGRPFVARTTLWMLGAEVLRVADGTRLLVEPPRPALSGGDIEPDCERGGIIRRLSVQELVDTALRRGLSLLLGR